MAHGLNKFDAGDLIDKAKGALQLIDRTPDQGDDASLDAAHETLRIVLENQIRIAETLDLIKKEFDKFEAGLGKIL